MSRLRMNRMKWITVIVVIVALAGLASWVYLTPRDISVPDIVQGSSGDAVFIKVSTNGISTDSSEVVVRNFRPGARAEMTYRIHNATAVGIVPEIYLNSNAQIADYSKADGAVMAPPALLSWLVMPDVREIPPGAIVDYPVSLVLPKNVNGLPDKFGFQVVIAGNAGGKVQTAVGTWWLINMR